MNLYKLFYEYIAILFRTKESDLLIEAKKKTEKIRKEFINSELDRLTQMIDGYIHTASASGMNSVYIGKDIIQCNAFTNDVLLELICHYKNQGFVANKSYCSIYSFDTYLEGFYIKWCDV